MRLSATSLALVLRLVAAVPRHQLHGGMPLRVISGHTFEVTPQRFESPEHGISKTTIEVDILTDLKSSSKSAHSEFSTTQERVPAWIFFDGSKFQGRLHGNTYWNLKGELEKPFPIHEFLLDPVLFSLNRPTDFEGAFSGSVGNGMIELKWESGATITGRADIGPDFPDVPVKGKTHVDWSP